MGIGLQYHILCITETSVFIYILMVFILLQNKYLFLSFIWTSLRLISTD